MTDPQIDVASPRRSWSARFGLGGWEIGLIALIVIVLVAGTITAPNFFSMRNFSVTVASSAGILLMVVPMAWLIIAGEIDLSVASVFGLAGVIFGLSIENGLGLIGAIVVTAAVCVIAGLINGVLTVDFGLPSLVVTIGTLALFRGAAYILLENRSISDFPAAFTEFSQGNVAGTLIPNSFIIFLVIAIVSWVYLQRGQVGRKVFAVGGSVEVSKYSGIRVRRVKRGLFVFSSLVAGLAGVLYAGYVSSARANNGTGLELSVIAIVLIGGVSMYGGKGSFTGVVLSLALVIGIGSWMNLKYVASSVQYTVIGLLMIVAVIMPVLSERLRTRRASRPHPQPEPVPGTAKEGVSHQ